MKDLASICERFSEIISSRTRELLQSIQFAFPPPDPRLSAVTGAMAGDPAAAERLALGINWQPDWWQRECIRIKSRVDGVSPDQVRRKALAQGVLLALRGDKENEVPILIGPKSMWLDDDQRNLATIDPFQELPMDYFWNWINEEAARAAGFWLLDLPYAPTVVLEIPPEKNSDWQFARFTSLVTDEQAADTRRGRPFGSGIFEDKEAFLEETRLAVTQVISTGNRVTQQRVAEVMSQRGLMATGGADRQLRYWIKQFGFAGWKDLLNSI